MTETTTDLQTMTVTAPWGDWQDAIKHASTVIPKRIYVPVVAYALVTVDTGTVTLTVTDFDVRSRRTLDATADLDGSFLLPVNSVLDALKGIRGRVTPAKARNENVSVTRDRDGNFTVCGFNRSLHINADAPDVADFPAWPVGAPEATMNISADAFLSAFKFAVVAAGKDDTLPVLTHVKIEAEADSHTATFAATDRYRLAVTDAPCDVHANIDALIPARAYRTLSSLTGDVRITVTDKGDVTFGSDIGTIIVHSYEGTFPAFRSLLPDLALREVPRVQFLSDVASAASVLDKGEPVRMVLTPDTLTVDGSAAIGTDGFSEDFISEPFAFKPSILVDGLKAFDSATVEFGGTTPRKPFLLRGTRPGGSGLYLAMPVKLPTEGE